MKTVLVVSFVMMVVFAIALVQSCRTAASRAPGPAPDDGRLRIRDLTIDDICSGRNWRATNPREFARVGETLNLEDLHIARAESFSPKDTVVYSCVYVTDSGQVSPVVLIKEVGDAEYGGDYCEIHAEKWRQVGLVPNPQAPHGQEYVANPLEQDPSFNTMDSQDDYRAAHRAGFRKWAAELARAPQSDEENAR